MRTLEGDTLANLDFLHPSSKAREGYFLCRLSTWFRRMGSYACYYGILLADANGVEYVSAYKAKGEFVV